MARHNRHTIVSTALWLVILLACGGGASLLESPTEPPHVFTMGPRSAILKLVEGYVEWAARPDSDFARAKPRQVLVENSLIRTGNDGHVVMTLDDGTAIVVTENTLVSLAELGGTHREPVTRLY